MRAVEGRWTSLATSVKPASRCCECETSGAREVAGFVGSTGFETILGAALLKKSEADCKTQINRCLRRIPCSRRQLVCPPQRAGLHSLKPLLKKAIDLHSRNLLARAARRWSGACWTLRLRFRGPLLGDRRLAIIVEVVLVLGRLVVCGTPLAGGQGHALQQV